MRALLPLRPETCQRPVPAEPDASSRGGYRQQRPSSVGMQNYPTRQQGGPNLRLGAGGSEDRGDRLRDRGIANCTGCARKVGGCLFQWPLRRVPDHHGLRELKWGTNNDAQAIMQGSNPTSGSYSGPTLGPTSFENS